jgi:hypothetical protein
MSIPRIFSSSKFQAAAFATALIAVPLIFTLTDKSVSRPEKQSATEKFIIATAGLWGIAVGGTAIEDYAAKRDVPAPAMPPVQVNTGSDAANTQAPIVDPLRTSSPAPPPKQL